MLGYNQLGMAVASGEETHSRPLGWCDPLKTARFVEALRVSACDAEVCW